MNLSTFCCEKCPLKFDKRIILEMYLNVVHKENNYIKEESTPSKNLMDLETENSPIKYKVGNLEVETKSDLTEFLLNNKILFISLLTTIVNYFNSQILSFKKANMKL